MFPFLKYFKINQIPSCAVHSPFHSLTLAEEGREGCHRWKGRLTFFRRLGLASPLGTELLGLEVEVVPGPG